MIVYKTCPCLEQVARWRVPDKDTQNKSNRRTFRGKRRGAVRAKPLGEAAPFSYRFCSSKKCCAFYFFIVFCVSLCINASSSSVPRISPSLYNVALSNRSNFCDHNPISVTTSSSAISAVMYDGKPRE